MRRHDRQTPAQMHYELQLTTTSSGTGYFWVRPTTILGIDESLAYLRAHPNDEFMHKQLLEAVSALEAEHAAQVIPEARHDPVMLALLFEASLLHDRLAELRELFDRTDARVLSAYTPLITIKSGLLEDQTLHFQWNRIFESNISEHQPLPAPDSMGIAIPFTEEEILAAQAPSVHVRDFSERSGKGRSSGASSDPSPEEIARYALEKLEGLGALEDSEMRHAASLSPYALLRRWRMGLHVKHGRHDYTLEGSQTSYGRGLDLPAARASCAMEIVERCSSFASFDPQGIPGYSREYSLLRARCSELEGRGVAALHPNRIRLEAPYEDEPLYWMEAEVQDGRGLRPILIPAQCVFLFCNLDEVSLFSGLGSTGLASGNTMERAKVKALLEVIERDAEAVAPYDPARCFRIGAKDEAVSALLSDYRARGIEVQFQDISPAFGVPCYKCFVVGRDGRIAKGTGADLDGKRALVSALTETPYPYPYGPASGGFSESLPTVCLEDFPDYSSGSWEGDLHLLETVLTGNGYYPIYVDLTRNDLQIPVVRALVPGLEIMADFDRFSRVSPRLFVNYLKMFEK